MRGRILNRPPRLRRRREGGEAVELESPDIGTPPRLIGRSRHRRLLIDPPGVAPPIGEPVRLLPQRRKRLNGLQGEPSRLHQEPQRVLFGNPGHLALRLSPNDSLGKGHSIFT